MRRQKYRGSVESVEEALVSCFAVMKVSRKYCTVSEASSVDEAWSGTGLCFLKVVFWQKHRESVKSVEEALKVLRKR